MAYTRFSHLYPYVESEARYACRFEVALKATDFIARRIRLSFLNVQITLVCLPRVIDITAEELVSKTVGNNRPLGWAENKNPESLSPAQFTVLQHPRKLKSLWARQHR